MDRSRASYHGFGTSNWSNARLALTTTGELLVPQPSVKNKQKNQ